MKAEDLIVTAAEVKNYRELHHCSIYKAKQDLIIVKQYQAIIYLLNKVNELEATNDQ